ncbi:MAG: methionine--tRNA ligase [Candidatus Saccharibacteria bacterium]
MNKAGKFYITTPIYYPSDNLHIGHAYTTVAADCSARYKRMQGFDVFYLTGTDEHGQKIERIAREKGVETKKYVDGIVENIQRLWEKLLISNNDFIRTTEERHKQTVHKIFQKIYEQGDIYKSTYEGWYCTPCETYFTERQLDNGNCPDCGRPVELLKEESYFFAMSKYQDRLLKHIEENPDFIQPELRRNEMVNFIKGGLEDLCISRTTFEWGIPVPFAPGHVVYVWFDALTNYLSAIGYGVDQEKFERYWPADVHLVGKDIVRFHTVIWPIILMAAGLPIPKQVFGHGWILLEGGKMSKSKGNVVDPIVLADKYGVDAVRYYLLKELTFGSDGVYSEEMLIKRTNTELANDLGNLVSRTAAMIERYFEGVLPQSAGTDPLDEDLKDTAVQAVAECERLLDRLDYSGALNAIWKLVNRANKYIDETAPWVLIKDPAQKGRLGTVLYNLAEAIRIITITLAPVMPTLPGRVNQQYGFFADPGIIEWDAARKWGLAQAGVKVNKGENLFPRVETEEKAEKIEKAAKKQEAEKKVTETIVEKPKVEDNGMISIEDFARMELKVAEVVACEKMEKADKLLILKVKLGEEERTVVSGIAQHYSPEELIGKKVILVANLKPAKLRGVESHGMILAATAGERVVVVTMPDDIPSGSKVK